MGTQHAFLEFSEYSSSFNSGATAQGNFFLWILPDFESQPSPDSSLCHKPKWGQGGPQCPDTGSCHGTWSKAPLRAQDLQPGGFRTALSPPGPLSPRPGHHPALAFEQEQRDVSRTDGERRSLCGKPRTSWSGQPSLWGVSGGGRAGPKSPTARWSSKPCPWPSPVGSASPEWLGG